MSPPRRTALRKQGLCASSFLRGLYNMTKALDIPNCNCYSNSIGCGLFPRQKIKNAFSRFMAETRRRLL